MSQGSLYCSVSNTTLCTGKLISYHKSPFPTFGLLQNCSEPCNGVYFTDTQQLVLQLCIGILSAICIICSLIALIIYVVNYRIIRHPESPIYYTSLCYIGISFPHLLSIVVGSDTIRCNHHYTNSYNQSIVLQDGFEIPLCAVMFAVLYYSMLASWTWWLVMTFEWMICSIRLVYINWKWLILSHIVGWGAPLPLVIASLSLHTIKGNVMLMTCWITSGSNGQYQLAFIIVPLGVLILLCSCFLLIGFSIGLKKIKQHSSANIHLSSSTRNVTKLLWAQLARTSSFSVLFLFINAVSFGCYLYEYFYQHEWEIEHVRVQVRLLRPSCFSDSPRISFSVLFGMYIVRIVASQLMGVVLLLWSLRKDLLCCCECKCRCDHNYMNTTINSNSAVLRSKSLSLETTNEF